MELLCAISAFIDTMYGVIADATIQRYVVGLGRFAKFTGETADVADVTSEHIRRWRREMAEKLRPHTINTYLGVTRRFFAWLVEEGHLARSPARSVRRMKTERMPRAVDRHDVELLVNHFARQRHRRNLAIVLFMFGTGCRVSGLAGLTMDRLLLNAGRARVIEKGGRTRWVFMSPPVVEAVREYIELDRPETGENFVFLNRYGRQLTRQGVWYLLRTAGDELGIQRVNPHSFRHAFAIERLRAGDNLSSVSALLGHASITTTQIYAVWESGALQEQHAKFDTVVSLTSQNGRHGA